MTVQRRAARSPETPAAGGKPGPPASARDVRVPYDHTRAVMAARTIETLARSTMEQPSDDDLRAAHEILLLLRRLAGQGSGGADPDLDRWNWAAQALNAAATLVEGITGWAARECGAPALADDVYGALPPEARRAYAAARLRLGLPVVPAAASRELALALEARAAGETTELLESSAARRVGGAPHALDVARLDLLRWVARQVGLGLVDRRADALRQAAAAVGHAESEQTLDQWRRRLRQSLEPERVDEELRRAEAGAKEEVKRFARLPPEDPHSTHNPDWHETMAAVEKRRLEEVAARHKAARSPARGRAAKRR